MGWGGGIKATQSVVVTSKAKRVVNVLFLCRREMLKMLLPKAKVMCKDSLTDCQPLITFKGKNRAYNTTQSWLDE